MTAKLKSCPFCGGQAEVIKVGSQPLCDDRYVVICRGCGTSSEWFDKKVEVIKAWNRRTENDDRKSD